MKNIYTYFRNNFFLYIIALLIFVIGVFSYYRFMIKYDYMVGYEGFCDPAIEKCFVGCEDDDCTEVYYYTKVEKYAPDLYNECGKDITDCEMANVCFPSDYNCSITYCDPEIDGDACEENNNIINNI